MLFPHLMEDRKQGTDGRTSIQLAEQERRGGIANRVSPMISMFVPHYPPSSTSLVLGEGELHKAMETDNRPDRRTIIVEQSRIHNNNSRC